MKKLICFRDFNPPQKFIYKTKPGPKGAPAEAPEVAEENVQERIQAALDRAKATVDILRVQISKVREAYEKEHSPMMKKKVKDILDALERHLKTLEEQVSESGALLKPTMAERQEVIEKTLSAIDKLVEEHTEEVESDTDIRAYVRDPMNPELAALDDFRLEYEKEIVEGRVVGIRVERARKERRKRKKEAEKRRAEGEQEEMPEEEVVPAPPEEKPSGKEKAAEPEKAPEKKSAWDHGLTVVAKLFTLSQPQNEADIKITTQEAAALPFFVGTREARTVWLDVETPEGKKISKPFKIRRSPKGGLIWLLGPDDKILAELPLRPDKPEKSTAEEWQYAETAAKRRAKINLETMTEEDVELVPEKRLLAHLDKLAERFLEYRIFEHIKRAEFLRRQENLLAFAYKIREVIPKGWKSKYSGPTGEVATIEERTAESGKRELVLRIVSSEFDTDKNRQVENEVAHYEIKPPKEGEIETNVA
jgi:hypothetical protein